MSPPSVLIDKKEKYTCMGCRLKFDTAEQQRGHFKTEWHLYNLKRKVCKLEPIDLDSFKMIQQASPNTEARPTKINQVQQIESGKHRDPYGNDDGNDSEWEDEDILDDNDLVDEDYDGDEAEEMLARVIKSKTCLFCDKRSADIHKNVAHMNLHHGFFIPEEQYVIDLDGLLEYLGFKVGAGLTCTWCNKQFSTLHGVRLHMLYKDHCKIYFDQDRAVDEFKEFYDYASQEIIPFKTPDQLNLPRKRKIRRFIDRNSKELVAARSNLQQSLLLTGSRQPQFTAKAIKKFNSRRAKQFLRIGMTNNNAMRGRLRQQNPI